MAMKKEIVYTDRYALILSDEIPTKVYYDTYIHQLKHTGGAEYGESSIAKTVVGHLPLTADAPILDEVPLLPPFTERVCNCGLKESEHHVRHPFVPQAEDVEELAKLAFPYLGSEAVLSEQNKHTDTLRCGFKEGYRAAKEKYRYTRLDMITAFKMGLRGQEFKDHFAEIWDEFVEFIDNPSRPAYFECETDYECCCRYVDCKGCDAPIETLNIKILTTQNSQGQVELVGKYL